LKGRGFKPRRKVRKGTTASAGAVPRPGREATIVHHEEDLISAFFAPNRRERYLEFLRRPETRRKSLPEMCHVRVLDPRHLVFIPPSQQHPELIAEILSKRGAPQTCWVTTENLEIDGKEMPLLEALREVVGYGMGTFLSCISGQLAYFEGEAMKARWILERKTAN